MKYASPMMRSYDVVIVGGAIMGSSAAWFLTDSADFDGSILVVERDPSYEFASTSHTNSCMRQQFSNELNIRISQFAAEFVRDFRSFMGGDPDVPDLAVNHFGYMYLADDDDFAAVLRQNQLTQEAFGAGTKIMSAAEIKAAYPFYNVEDIICGSHNLVDEGYFDGGTMFEWWRRKARQNGAEYLANEVVDVSVAHNQVESVTLATGETVSCGTLINASGPRSVEVAKLAGFTLPVEPRKRYTFIFDAADKLDQTLPLTIDPSGVHVRDDGGAYLAGCPPDVDTAVAYDDFAMDPDVWEDKVWPALANRIPAFERIKVQTRWAGHYAYNTVDHNVVVGPHPEVNNFVFMNGFSGHGLQQSPAMGRGVSELVAHGSYQTLDLSSLGYERILANVPFVETAII